MSELNPRFNYTGHGIEGANYDDNLGIKEIAQKVRKHLKVKYPRCKFSVVIQRYAGGQSLHISLMEANFKAIICDTTFDYATGRRINVENKDGHAQLSPHFEKHYETEEGNSNGTRLTKSAWDCMKEATRYAHSFNYDDSDGMIDYFHTNFYMHLNIGRWDKPFRQI